MLPPSLAGGSQVSETALSSGDPATFWGAPGGEAPGGDTVAIETSSKSLLVSPSFQSWRRCRLAVWLKLPFIPQDGDEMPFTYRRAVPLAVPVYWIPTWIQALVPAPTLSLPVKIAVLVPALLYG